MIISPFIEVVSDPLNLDHDIIWNPLSSGCTVVRAKAGKFDSVDNCLSVDTQSFLQKERFIFDDNSAAFATVSHVTKSKFVETERLVLMPTGACQLSCGSSKEGGYCGQIHTNDRLTKEDLREVKSKALEICKSSQCKRLELTFFGGEPTINFPFILDALSLCRIAIDEFRSKNFERNITLCSSIVSNGVLLTGPRFKDLWNAGVRRYEVTLDGVGRIHDLRRPGKDGSGSFERIASNLNDIANLISGGFECDFVVRCNVDVRNIDGLPQLLKFLEVNQLVPPLGFYIAPVRNWGLKSAADSFGSRVHFAKWESFVFHWLVRRGLMPALIPSELQRTCIAASPKPNVLGPDRYWYFCTEAPLVEKLLMPTEQLPKRWQDLNIDQWHQKLSTDEMPCNRCKYLPVCGGSCPKDWLSGEKPCPPFIDNIKDRLRLFSIAKEKEIPTLKF